MSETAQIDKIDDIENGLYDMVKNKDIKCINNHKIAERNEKGTIEIKCHRCKHVTEVK